MKRLLVITLALGLALASTISAQKVKDGFRGHPWGTPFTTIDSLIDMSLSEEEGDLKFHTTDIESLGGAKVECSLGFYKDQFYSVFITTSERSDSRALLKALKEVYGKPKQPNQFMEKYTWSTRKSWRSYDQNSITGAATFIMMSTDISNQKEADEKEVAKKAKDEF